MVSLVVATFNRVTELERLLDSLSSQTYKNFEVIIVDQNSDDRVTSVLHRYPEMPITHLRSELGVSRARNAGLRIAKGDVVGFPDDDCWYPQSLLATVTAWLDANAAYDGLIAATRTQEDKLQAPKFPAARGACTGKSILRCAVIVSTFLRKHAVKAIGFFREDIGPGTSSQYQSGEDIDYVIRPLKHGMKLFYEPSITVYHPDLNNANRLRRVTFPYSVGLGHILRLQGYSWWTFSEVVARSISGAIYYLLRCDLERTYIYSLRAAGQVRGYLSPVNSKLELKNLS